MNEIGVLLAFVALVALPFIPGFLLLRRRLDLRPLRVDPHYSRDPRFFGEEPRARLEPLLRGETLADSRSQVLAKADLTPGLALSHSLVLTSPLLTPENVRFAELYLVEGGHLGADNQADSIIADADLILGPNIRVRQFVDVQGRLVVRQGGTLGSSAAATAELQLTPGTHFRRLFGHPISTQGEPDHAPSPSPHLADDLIWSRDALRLPGHQTFGSGIVTHGALYVGEGTTVRGDLKAYGDVHLLPGAQVEGNVVARGSVILYGHNRVHGHVHTERDLSIGSGSTLGREDVLLSVYAAGRAILAPQVRVSGYLVAERGGEARGASDIPHVAPVPAATEAEHAEAREEGAEPPCRHHLPAPDPDPLRVDGLEESRSAALLDRTEDKFLIQRTVLPDLMQRLVPAYRILTVAELQRTPYLSVYLDTPDFQLFRAHHDGRPRRYKVRFRSYEASGMHFLEVKQRQGNGQTHKRRVLTLRPQLPFGETEASFLRHHLPEVPVLEAKVEVRYSRVTLVGRHSPERLTLDLDLSMTRSDGSRHLNLPEVVVIELKRASRHQHSVFVEVARDLQLRGTAFSKYGNGCRHLYDVKSNAFKAQQLYLERVMRRAL